MTSNLNFILYFFSASARYAIINLKSVKCIPSDLINDKNFDLISVTSGESGWRVSRFLNDTYTQFWINSTQETLDCPVGVTGGHYIQYQYNEQVTDPTFTIECHLQEKGQEGALLQKGCPNCEAVNVSASGAILKNFPLSLGVYKRDDRNLNGYPMYRMLTDYQAYKITSLLYFKKDGKICF